jgi:SecD/SecF fusion protein
MKNHLYRNLAILAVIVVALFQIYPTIGWMALSEEARAERLETFRHMEEERLMREPSFFRDSIRDLKRWALFDRDRVINLGLDLQGGIHMVIGFDLTPDVVEQGLAKSEIQEMVLQKILRRINEFEAKEPIIQKLGDDQIQIQLPGEKNRERAMNIIKRTAYLTFHMAAFPAETRQTFIDIDRRFNNGFIPLLTTSAFSGGFTVPVQHIDQVRQLVARAEEEGLVPAGRMIGFGPEPRPWEARQEYSLYLLESEPAHDGAGLRVAKASPDQRSPGQWRIEFEFDAASAYAFAEVTERNLHRNMAIVIDDVVISAPTIQSRIMGQGEITGNFTANQATDLAIALNSGSMPVPIKEDSTNIIGPTLGADSIEKGVRSAILGLILVVIFMLIYYRLAGVMATLALVLNAILILGALAYFNATLTLPGIAGLILTIGMAVDANVLIYERIREELRNGKSLLAAIDSGYARAAITILDANITTLIAGFVLFEFGTGPVEGFAVTLCIGVVASVFTALIFTRAVLDFLTERKLVTSLHMMSIVKPDTRIPFMQYRKVGAMVSVGMIVLGIALFGIRFDNMFGVDFREGTNVTLRIDTAETINVGTVRSRLADAGFDDARVIEVADLHNEFNISTARLETTEAEQAAGGMIIASQMQEALRPLADRPDAALDEAVPLLSEQSVGPAVGEQLRRDALLAISYAMACILLYVAFRFEFWYALGAIVATLHDVIIVVALFALTGREITMNVVAAILTIVGYSLNDTIVVYDRIREDRRLYRGKGHSMLEIMNMSINQTLSRTLLTSGTTLMVVLVLLFLGGTVINDFAFALFWGIVVGTYSSIFVASPFVYYAQTWWAGKRQRRLDAKADVHKRGKKKPSAPELARR